MKPKYLGFKAYLSSNLAFATFEYQKVEFDFFCDLDESTMQGRANWRLLEDQAVNKLKKIANLDKLIGSCLPYLEKVNTYLFEGYR